MMNLKAVFIENWPAKLASLLIATAIWYLIRNHLDADQPSFPVPGTSSVPARPSTGTILDDTLLSPPAPPVPGNDSGN
ncbi:MAG: hypothetical protein P1U81_10660 [Verrucomicrobiales bacterium]|nr:hypothetical protein [Verrucomicrobiales bacterium]